MNKLRKLLIFALFVAYALGILAGAIREIKVPDAADMYEYLEKGIEGYDTAAVNGIKSAGADNLKIFALIAGGSLFKPLVWLIVLAMLLKGYLTGFSLMAAMRLYGIKGILLCVPNLISAAVLIPSAIYYGGINMSGQLGQREKREFYKRFVLATIFFAAIFCADAILKGALSPIFVKWASKLIKAA